MNLSKKLIEWQREDLIDIATVEKINEYEAHLIRPIALLVVGGLGVFSVLVGIISVIASNWHVIPAWLKLFSTLLINLCLAIALYRLAYRSSDSNQLRWVQELLVIFYYGFILGSIALITQTYQLGWGLNLLLLVWTLITIPLMLLGRGKFHATIWMIGFGVTFLLNVEVLYYFFEGITHSEFHSNVLLCSLLFLTPLLFVFLSCVPWLYKNRPVISEALSGWSWFFIILIGWLSQFFWYDNAEMIGGSIKYVTSFCIFTVALLVYLIPKMYTKETAITHLTMRTVLIASLFFSAVGAYFWQSNSMPIIGALSNLIYLSVLAWAALKIKSTRYFNTVTAFICMRIVVIYLEVFGTMLDTGLGLIVGGTLTLFVAWWWLKKSDNLARRLTKNGQA
jgi:hypothetical protein